MSLIMV